MVRREALGRCWRRGAGLKSAPNCPTGIPCADELWLRKEQFKAPLCQALMMQSPGACASGRAMVHSRRGQDHGAAPSALADASQAREGQLNSEIPGSRACFPATM